LLLDEPTIGLDVVAQVKIQECLRDYNNTRGVTMLLTSHYMRDVEALCKRVLIINHGKVVYDGQLAGIVERFGSEKILKLQFKDTVPANLASFGTLASSMGPAAELRVERKKVAKVLNDVLDQFQVVDLSVQDPPLEQMIAQVFEEAAASTK
jgi:ABC-2 type transport system ATP-binding protein